MKKKFMGIAAFVLTASLLLSACSSSSKKEEKDSDSDLNEEIVEVIDKYFDQITDMSFSKLSKSVENSSFAEMDLKSDEFDVLNALMGKVKYEITEADGKEKKGTGSAVIELSYVDLKDVLKGLDDDADAEELISVIKDKKTKAVTEEVEIDLTYDKSWKIADDEPIYELITGSFDDACELISGSNGEVTVSTESTTHEAPPDTSESTTEYTTTEDTTTTAAPTRSTYETVPAPAIVDRHILSKEDLKKVMTDYGMELDEEEDDDMYTLFAEGPAEDIQFIYAEFKDSALCQQYYEMFCAQLLDLDAEMFSDEWSGNTHNIYAKNIASEDNHSYDFYIYRDNNTILIGGIDEYPGADANEGYLELMQKLGLWDFGFSID
ncbi:MAG: hypothetical protein J5379_04625 [Clostridiales bacterium]|nr:hypothetical protein [Clostridiales bacterium]